MPKKTPAKPKTSATPATRNKPKALPSTENETTTEAIETTNERTESVAERSTGLEQSTPPAETETEGEMQGDDRLSVDSTPEIGLELRSTREETQADATRRWRNEGIGDQVAAFRDRIREEYRLANPGCKRRDAHEHAWDAAMARFPPPGVEPIDLEPEEMSPIGDKSDKPISVAVAPAPPKDDQGVSGLSDLPPHWPELPANAQLQVEIAWVTANRLRVRDGTGVNLAKALSPAPSYSALSWLETSILFPAKFADISVKATASQDDEREHIRREKLAIEEIRGILSEMLEAKSE